uniref:Protein-L-isoaspartate O-methyltransferase n=1 Tax=Opuntia streptacantha TaxID=393608 RepID=A0A7C9DLK7_OPUST
MPLLSSSLRANGYPCYKQPLIILPHSKIPPHQHPTLLLPRAPTAPFRPFSLFGPTSSSLATPNSQLSGMEPYFSVSGKNKNQAMVEQLQRQGVIHSRRVAEVMAAMDRGLFVPPGTPAYVDSPMPIGYNATISAPHMHAMCLELLKDHLQPGMRALDVGSGTGYLTACFAMMVGPEGRAVGIEHIPELVSWSIENIKKSPAAPLLKSGALSIHAGDGRLGWPEAAPYDAIHVGAAAPQIPKPLLDQLKPGGRMVIPVGTFFQGLQVVDKNLDGTLSVRTETSVRYVPLTSADEQLRGF